MAEMVGNLPGIGPISTSSLHTQLVGGGGRRKYYNSQKFQSELLNATFITMSCLEWL